MNERKCGVCEHGHVSPDHYVCWQCAGRFRNRIHDLPDLMHELELVITRQTRYTDKQRITGGETPLPFNAHASEVAHVTRMTILVHVDEIARTRNETIPQTWATIEQYLRNQTGWLTTHPDGAQRIDEIIASIDEATRAIDRPRERRYIGTCGALIETDGTPIDCPEELYTAFDATQCPRCGTPWNTETRQTEMLDRLRNHLMPAADLARTLTIYGHPAKADTIRKWAKRGHIETLLDDDGKRLNNDNGQPLYRLGDALNHLKKEPA